MQKVKTLFILLFIVLLSNQLSFSQTIKNIDSLKNVLRTEKKDSITLKIYLEKIDKLNGDDINAVEVIGNWIIENCLSKSYLNIKAWAFYQLGKCYNSISDFTKATESFNASLKISEENHYTETQCRALYGLFNVFITMDQSEKAMPYLNQGLAIAEKTNYKLGIAMGKSTLAGRMDDEGYPKTKDTFNLRFRLKNEALQIFKDLADTTRIIVDYVSTGELYAMFDAFDSAISTIAFAKPYITPNNNEALMKYYFILGKIYNQKAGANNDDKNDLLTSIKYLKLSLPIAQQFNFTNFVTYNFGWLSSSYRFLGDYKSAFEYLNKQKKLRDSTISDKNFKEVTNIQHKYENEKKDNEILKLALSNNQKSNTNKVLLGSAVAFLFIGFLGYRNFKNKQKVSSQQQQLQQQQITQLEKDKQLLAIDAMLKGQEEERSRIAKDLHDGLGGMLSGTKLSFINMKENLILTPENATQFDKSLSMLDNTIADLRKVAHNLMPEALVKFGLDEAVRDFCNSIQSSSTLKVVYQKVGENRKLNNTAEVFTYRIIQELVNNVVKHANATQIIVQLNINNNQLHITVEDDGKGFDVNNIANSKGAGMDNIKYRVQYFNGTLDIVTKPNNGTSINIELMA